MAETSNIMGHVTRLHLPRKHLPALYLALAGLIVSVMIFGAVRKMERARIQADIDRAGEHNVAAIAYGLDNQILKLEALAGLYAGSEEVTRAEFRNFVQFILGRRAGLRALAWVPRVPASLREKFEADAQNDGLPDFQLTEMDEDCLLRVAPERPEYFPIYFIEPYNENAAALGFDIGSDSVRLEAMQRACDTGQVAITARVRLPQETGQHSFIMLFPVYRRNTPLDTVEQRRQNLVGFYLSASHAGELLQHVLTQRPLRYIDIYIFDASAPPDSQFLHFSPAESHPEHTAPRWTQITAFSGYHHQANLKIGGREWLVLTAPAPRFLAARRAWEPWAILVIGAVFSLLLAGYVSAVLYGAAAARQFAAAESKSRQQLQREIAVRKRAEKQRQQLMEALADRNKEMTNLLYVVSHDLRAPLVNIRGFSNELGSTVSDFLSRSIQTTTPAQLKDLADNLAAKLNDSMKFISTSTEKMEKLLDGLLGLSRTGRVELRIKTLDMDDLIRNVVDSISFLIRDAGASIEVRPLPPCLGDEDQINQVFANLLGNALKYLDPSRPGRITVYGRAEADSSIYAVKDNGIGIPLAHQDRIFELFHRVDPASSVAGEGLGLATVKQILLRHNGRIWLESSPGQGSCFFVALPRPQPSCADEEKFDQYGSADEETISPPRGNTKK